MKGAGACDVRFAVARTPTPQGKIESHIAIFGPLLS